MGKTKEISQDLRGRVVDLWQKDKLSYGKIAQHLQLRKSTVQKVLMKFKAIGTTENQPRTGRPRKLSLRTEIAIV